MMKRKPNIATVAKEAGVGVGTVSRYLNGGYVSQEARRRLSQAITKLEYSRSSLARNLSLGRKGCIGVTVDSTVDPWFTQLLAGIEEGLVTSDTSLMLSSLELRGEYDPSTVIAWIRDSRIDGLIIAKSQKRERSLLHAAIDAHLPTVMVAPDESIRHVHVVRCDNRAAGIALAHHLSDLGHTKIAFAGGPEHSIDSKHRLVGLQDGLSKRDVSLDAKSIFSCGSWEAEAGAGFAKRFFDQRLEITAIVMANDALALGFMRAAQLGGVRIPQEISVAGFDDVPEGAYVWPGLTTMAQPMREMGKAACRVLLDGIASPIDLKRVEFSMQLHVRESTAPPRR
jgi:LacI family transcriptional regulator